VYCLVHLVILCTDVMHMMIEGSDDSRGFGSAECHIQHTIYSNA